MNKINFLPPWVETNLQPSFYDVESGTCLQQTSRMYAKVNQLVRTANEQNETIADYIQQFINLRNYVEDYFDNLDVQVEINNKLDEMASDGSLGTIINEVVQPTITELNNNYEAFTDEVDADIAQIRGLVDSAVGQTPIVVSDASAMTDHTKIYVLSTDGEWYYWDGDSWESGGNYQATAISNNSVTKAMTTFRKQSGNNLLDWTTATVLHLNASVNPLSTNASCRCVYIPVEHNTVYTVSKIASERFTVALTNALPANGVSRVSVTTDNDATEITVAVGSNASYMVVMYCVTSVDTLDEETILKSLTIVKSNKKTYPNSVDYYALSIGNDDLNTGAVSPSKTTFCRESENAYDHENPYILNCFFNSNNTSLSANNNMRTVVVPCEASSTYTIVKPSESARFGIGYLTTQNNPAIGDAVSGIQNNDQAHTLTITTGANATYIVVYLANTTIMNFEDASAGLMVYKGVAPDYYVEHKLIDVKTENIRDRAVTKDKLASDVLGDNYLSSRSKVYGIKFSMSDDSATVERIADAKDLRADYVIGDDFQLNGGVNDFDNIYPWSDMRLCNVSFDEHGNKVITYADEAGFARDGSNGEVMVEIPKFYSFRQRIGGYETWAISGEKKAGFEVEPLFKTADGELDFAYIGAYNGTGETVESHSGAMPQVNTTISNFISQYNGKGLNTYDITAFFALQKLMMIEFATRNLQTYFGGITNQSYMRQSDTLNPDGVIKAIDTNEVSVAMDANQRPMYFFVGQKIKFGQQGHGGEMNYTNSRTITAISYDSDTGYVDITYDGTDLSATLGVDTWGVYGMPQLTGLTDSLIYHTGRTNFATAGTNSSKRNLNNAFKYRNIENVYGNVWERTAGIIIKDLKAYVSYDTDQIDLNSGTWLTTGISVPYQPNSGHAGQSWIVEESYNRELPLIVIPSKIGSSNGGGDNKYFSDSFYSKNQEGVSYYSVTGGGWDHSEWAGAFTLRSYEAITSSSWLYGNRPIIRK